MAGAKLLGGHGWQGQVRPPSEGTQHIFNFPVMSAIRIVGSMRSTSSYDILRPLELGGVGVPPVQVLVSLSSLLTHVRQLNHSNPLVRGSSRWGLLHFAWCTNSLAPCWESFQESTAHKDDHSRRLSLWARLGWRLHVPADDLYGSVPHPMGWQATRDGATGVHAWMESGLSVGEARSAGHWVSPPERASLTLPPVLGEAIPLE